MIQTCYSLTCLIQFVPSLVQLRFYFPNTTYWHSIFFSFCHMNTDMRDRENFMRMMSFENKHHSYNSTRRQSASCTFVWFRTFLSKMSFFENCNDLLCLRDISRSLVPIFEILNRRSILQSNPSFNIITHNNNSW